MRKLLVASVIGMFSLATHASAPPEAAACAGCHGPAGIAPNPQWPNLAGQNKEYLVISLKAFRDGSRTNPMMSPMAKPLSDEAIEKIAAYFSSLK